MDTRFHIDYEWWDQSDKDIGIAIRQLCEEYGVTDLSETPTGDMVDWVDPHNALVARVDTTQYRFLTFCCGHPDFITERTTLIEACFRALLAANNYPMTAIELAQRTGRPSDVILKTLTGRAVYKGIRPFRHS